MAMFGRSPAIFNDGYLCYEYNLFILQPNKIRSADPIPSGPGVIEIETAYEEVRPGGPMNISIQVNGAAAASGRVPISVPLLFANDCLDIGTCLGGPVSLDHYDRTPFPFTGTIDLVNVRYTS